MSINRVNISGNLTRDPELRQTQSGNAVLTFGVAVNDRRKNQQTGEWEDYPNFVDCVLFGNRATGVSKFLSKGMKVAIEGKLRYDQWKDKQTGQNRSKLSVIVEEIEFLSNSKAESAPQNQQPETYSAPPAAAPNSAPSVPQSDTQGGWGDQPGPGRYAEEDIPF